MADGGRHLRHGLRRAESFDATREQPLERRGKRRRHSRRGGDDPGSLGGALRHRQRQLLREERIAAGSGGDETGGIFVHARAEHRARNARGLVGRERRHGDLGRVPGHHETRPLRRAIRQEQENARAGEALGQRGQVRLGGAVDPVHVLDGHHERLPAARGHAHAHQRLQRPRAHGLRAETREPLVRGPAQEVQEEGGPFVGVEAESAECPPHLVGDDVAGIHLGEAAGGADEIENGEKRRPGAVRHALALEISHLAGGQALAELVEQARLADAGLAGDAHEPALPAHGQRQVLLQQLELGGAPDKAGHAPAGSEPRALEPGDAVGARAGHRRGDDRRQRKAAAQERGGVLADGDAAGRGHEALEGVERRLLGQDVDKGGVADLPRGDGGRVDGAAHGGNAIAGAALLGHSLGGETGQGGPDRSVFDRLLDAKRGDRRALTQLLDAATEAPDLVEQLVERSARLGQPLRAGPEDEVHAQKADLARLGADARPRGRDEERPSFGDGRGGQGDGDRRGRRAWRDVAPDRGRRARRLGERACRRRAVEPEARDARAHRIARDPERGGRVRDVPARLRERGQEVLTHPILPGARLDGHRVPDRSCACRRGQSERGGGDHRSIAQQDRALEDIAQLPNIARPAVAGQRDASIRSERALGKTVVRAGPGEKVLRENQDVGAALAERRQRKRDDGEAMVEVLAKVVARHRGAKILVGGGHDPHVGGLGARAAQTAHRALLERREELGLERRGEQADLVEEQRAAMRELKEAGLGLARVGERALLVAEQLGFEQAFGDRGAVDVDERLAGAGPRAMDGPGEEALARAGLPENQERRGTGGDGGGADELLHLAAQGNHGGAVTDQLRERVHDAPILPHRADEAPRTLARQRPPPVGTRPSCMSAHCASLNGGNRNSPSCWRERKRLTM